MANVTASRLSIDDGTITWDDMTISGTLTATAVTASGAVTGTSIVATSGSISATGINDTGATTFNIKNASGSSKFAIDTYGQNVTSPYITWSGNGVDILGAAGQLDMNNLPINNVGAGENNWTTNAITLKGGASNQTLTVETTGSSALALVDIKTPASSTGYASLAFYQGDGSGSANNMRYIFAYDGPNGQMDMRSVDIDGSSTDGDIWRVADGTDDMYFLGGVGVGVAAPTSGLDVKVTADQAVIRAKGLNNNIAAQIGSTNNDEGYLDLFDGASTKVRIAANMTSYFNGGNVGIGETASANLLHVKASDTGIAPHASAQIVLEREGTNYLQFLTAEAGTSGILFGDGSDVDVGKIYYDHNVPAMYLMTETAIALTIDASQNIGIGTGYLTQANDRYLRGKDTAGTDIRLIGLSSSNDIYLGAVDAITGAGSLIFRIDGNNVGKFDDNGNLDLLNNDLLNVGAAGMQMISGEMRVGGDAGKFVAPYTDAGTAYAGSFGWNHLNLGNNGINYLIAGQSNTGASLQFVVNNTSTITTNGSGHNGTLALTIANTGVTTFGANMIVNGSVFFGSDGTNHDVTFYGDTSGKNMTWNAGSSGGSLIFNDNTLLQIGTGGDIYMYHDGTHNYIEGAAPQSGTYALVTFKSTGGANTYSGITLDTAHATTQAHFRFAINGALKWQWRVPAYDHTGFVAYSWVLGADVMIMASNGNVGIGTDKSPDYKLDVQGTFRADGAASFGSTLGAGATTLNSLDMNGGGISNVASILALDYMSISGTGSGFGSASASWPLRIEADTNDDAQIQAYNDFYLRCADGDMYLLPNGDSWDDVYIGDGGALCRVHLNGTGAYSGLDWMDNGTWKWAAWYHTADSKLYFRRNASPDVDVMAFTDGSNDVVFTGNVTAYSDKRLKTNIKTIDSALGKVNQMRGVTYDRIDYPSSGAGVLAQELEEIAPELIDNTNKYKGVSYGNLTAYLVEAIKELTGKVDSMQQQLEGLNG